MSRLSPFGALNTLFVGFALSLAFGLIGASYLWVLHSHAEAQLFFQAYTSSFRTLVSLGLILGTAAIVFRCQADIPSTIEKAFVTAQLSDTDYFRYKSRFYSWRRSIAQPSLYIIFGFLIFSYSRFPLAPPADGMMIGAACVQYALGAYIGRKLFYAGMMLHSLRDVVPGRNLFKKRELDDINTYVNAASTMTVIFVYMHVVGYYEGPFLYNSLVGPAIRQLILLPAIVATPVLLIFNFYPRSVLRKLYSRSIDLEIWQLRAVLKNESLSAFEKRSHIIEFERMSREELRYSLQLTLTDLPIGITILVMALESVLN